MSQAGLSHPVSQDISHLFLYLLDCPWVHTCRLASQWKNELKGVLPPNGVSKNPPCLNESSQSEPGAVFNAVSITAHAQPKLCKELCKDRNSNQQWTNFPSLHRQGGIIIQMHVNTSIWSLMLIICLMPWCPLTCKGMAFTSAKLTMSSFCFGVVTVLCDCAILRRSPPVEISTAPYHQAVKEDILTILSNHC